MRLHLVLLICLCLAALSAAKEGKSTRRQTRLAFAQCQSTYRTCVRTSMNPDQTKVCKKSFNDCKTSVKNILAKVGGVKPGGKPKGGKRGGGSKKRPGHKQHFCHCFKKLVSCIKKHHNKTQTDNKGQKVTVHEEIFSNAQSAVDGSDDGDDDMKDMDKPGMDSKKKCIRHFKCCLSKQRCKPKRGGKGRGGKSKRKQRGADSMNDKSKRGKKMRKRPSKKGGPFASCIDGAKKCKQEAGKSKKQLKACSKKFVKCILGKCKKG